MNLVTIRKVKYGIVMAAMMLVINNCVEPYFPPAIVTDHNYLAVNGFLVNNDSTFIRLSYSQAVYAPNSFDAAVDASLEIESENGNIYALTEMGNGLYVAPPLNLDPTLTYRLHIRTNDLHEYFSEYVPLKLSPPLDSVTWKEDKADEEIELSIFAHDPLDDTRYYYWSYDETWEYTSAAVSIYTYEHGDVKPRKNASEINRCWKTQPGNSYYLHSTTALSRDLVHNFNFINIPQSSRKLYFGYSMLVSQYALTQEAYEYWSLVQKTSEPMGTMFDPIPAQTVGNIQCTTHPDEIVIGHFSASSVQKQRIFIDRQEITGPSQPYSESGYEECLLGVILFEQISDESMQDKLVHDKHFDLITQLPDGYIVGTVECMDCRRKGGSLKRPDFWP